MSDVTVVIKKPGLPISMGDVKKVSSKKAAEMVKSRLAVYQNHLSARLIRDEPKEEQKFFQGSVPDLTEHAVLIDHFDEDEK